MQRKLLTSSTHFSPNMQESSLQSLSSAKLPIIALLCKSAKKNYICHVSTLLATEPESKVILNQAFHCF